MLNGTCNAERKSNEDGHSGVELKCFSSFIGISDYKHSSVEDTVWLLTWEVINRAFQLAWVSQTVVLDIHVLYVHSGY